MSSSTTAAPRRRSGRIPGRVAAHLDAEVRAGTSAQRRCRHSRCRLAGAGALQHVAGVVELVLERARHVGVPGRSWVTFRPVVPSSGSAGFSTSMMPFQFGLSRFWITIASGLPRVWPCRTPHELDLVPLDGLARHGRSRPGAAAAARRRRPPRAPARPAGSASMIVSCWPWLSPGRQERSAPSSPSGWARHRPFRELIQGDQPADLLPEPRVGDDGTARVDHVHARRRPSPATASPIASR